MSGKEEMPNAKLQKGRTIPNLRKKISGNGSFGKLNGIQKSPKKEKDRDGILDKHEINRAIQELTYSEDEHPNLYGIVTMHLKELTKTSHHTDSRAGAL